MINVWGLSDRLAELSNSPPPSAIPPQMFLTRFAVSRPVTTLMGSLIVVILGWTSLTNLRIDLMPEVTWPIISVNTAYPGAGPEEMETLVTRPMEQAIGSVQGVEELQSSSVEGSANVRVQFAWGTDLDPAIGDIRARLERIRQNLPPDVETPYIRRYDSSDSPIIYLGLETDLPPVQATELAENIIAPQLERVNGVARIRVRGRTAREIQIDLDRRKLESLNMSVTEVLDALRQDNINQPAGDYDEGHLKLLVRSRGEFTSLDQIGNTVVREQAGATVQIRDIATLVDGEEERTEVTRVNGKKGLLLYVYQQAGANTVEVSDGIHAAIEAVNATNPNIRLSIRMDKSDFIRQAIGNVRQAALLGSGLAIIVLVLFLRSFRSTLVIAVSLPLSVLATFVLIYFNGFTLNMISFGGLALGMGLLVDNSIVVLESIFRKREEGLPPAEASVEGTQEVASAIVASTMTTLVVFLPLLFIGDQTGILLRELATVVSFSLLCSLVASLSLTPMLAAHWIPETESERLKWLLVLVTLFHEASRRVFSVFEKTYGWLLARSLKAPLIVTFLMLLLLAVSLGLTPRIGTEFIPKTDEGRLMVNTEMAPGIQLKHLFRQAVHVEKTVIDAVPESTTTGSFIGDDSDDAEDWNQAWFSVHLVPRDERTRTVEDIRKALDGQIGRVPGMEIKVRVRNDTFGSRMFSENGENLAVEIRGHDQKTAEELSERVAEAMEKVSGLVNVESTKSDRRPELSVRFDREKISSLGISVSDISQTLETAVHGTQTTVFRENGNEYNVVVQLRESDRSELAHIEQVGVATPAGRIVPLKNLVSFNPGESPVSIRRQDRQRVMYVTANVEDRDLGHVVKDLQQELNKLPPVEGFVMRVAGDWEDQQRSFKALTWGFILAVLLMYMVMASQFESLGDPVLILLTLPLAAIGVVAILLVTATTLNVQSFIGLVMLAGIVVNNAIVLVDYMNQLRRREPDTPIADIVQKASVRRFRPILMTTLTTVLAMTPIALGLGDGGELQAPMARVVIGGLTSATLITLLAIPIAWRAAHSAAKTKAMPEPAKADAQLV
jgi:hydrophobic/amphiphilic exporter-1 (mainly G- bacteria), HAE1 family